MGTIRSSLRVVLLLAYRVRPLHSFTGASPNLTRHGSMFDLALKFVETRENGEG